MASLWFWVVIFMCWVNVWHSFACLDEERIALLHIKTYFNTNSHHFPSWVDDKKINCCKWEGVICSNITRKVIELHIENTYAYEYFNASYFNASMFLPFKNLVALHLSGNFMAGWFKNEGFDKLSKLRKLEVLDLSYNDFNRSVLSSLNHVSSLKSLNLLYAFSWTTKPSFERLSGLTNLEVLSFSSNKNFRGDVLSVLNLNDFTSLKHLDLSSNDFQTFGSGSSGYNLPLELPNLEVLELSGNKFNNDVFASLKELSSLKSLDLSYNNLNGTIFREELDALSNLEVLDLSGNAVQEFQFLRGIRSRSHIRELQLNMMRSNSSKLLQSLQKVGFATSLEILSISSCGLTGTQSQMDLCSLEILQKLDLSYNDFYGMLPSCLANLTFLRLLDVSGNSFTGNIAFSSLSKLTSLEHLIISGNRFEIPVSFEAFANHTNLVVVEANGNTAVPEPKCPSLLPKFQLETFSMSDCSLLQRTPCFLRYQNKLRSIELSRNHLGGSFPTWLLENNTLDELLLGGNSYIGSFNLPSRVQSSIRFIDLSENQLSGQLQTNISLVLPNLITLYVGGNFLEGHIPCNLWSMKHIDTLFLSNNQFSGELPTELSIPPSLRDLRLNGNRFIGEIPSTLSSSDLGVLELSNNSFSGMIPLSMGQMSRLHFLSLSHNQLQGHIPVELCNLGNLQILDLSENQFSGVFPSCFSKLEELSYLKLNNNHLSGTLAHAFQTTNSRLLALDLSDNNFKGSIPQGIQSLSDLKILLLKNNQFEGEIPSHLCHLQDLRMTDLSYNKLIGSIPPCLGIISGYSWGWPSSGGYGLKVEFTTKSSSRNYEGDLLFYMSGIDLSSNQLSGQIPMELGNLSTIQVLNFSHNNLTGAIPKSFSKLHEIECIDLSYNNLIGKIPHELLQLHSLAVFKVAHNNLSGTIPEPKGQFSTFDESSFEGNPFLCGTQIHVICNNPQSEHPLHRNSENEEEEEGFMDMEVFHISFSVAYSIFFTGVIITLCINRHWRNRWFSFVENLALSCYYFLVDRFYYCRW